MTLYVSWTGLGLPESEAWQLLFDIHRDFPTDWAVVGAQMVVLHAASHGIARPTRTRDVDVLVDLRSLRPAKVAGWLKERGFDLVHVSPDGVGHEFRRGAVRLDVLGTDHAGPRTDKVTLPPARTIEVPGGRRAVRRIVTATVEIDRSRGTVPVPDWIGALLLKARAALELNAGGKHLGDLALLLGLPVDVVGAAAELSSGERRRLGSAIALIDDPIWRSLGSSGDRRVAAAASRLLTS